MIVEKLTNKNLDMENGLKNTCEDILIKICELFGETNGYGFPKGWKGFHLPNEQTVLNEYGEKISGVFYKNNPTPTLAFILDGYPSVVSPTSVSDDVYDKLIETCVELFNI